jgi:flagellar basal-body rod protein FlgC
LASADRSGDGHGGTRLYQDPDDRSLRIACSGRAHAHHFRKHRQFRFHASAAGRHPYRRKIPTFRSELDRTLDTQLVELGKVQTDSSAFRIKYEPGHPSADSNGNVKYPNVNALIEMTDMREAQRSYEANINVISATRRMIQRTIDILKA